LYYLTVLSSKAVSELQETLGTGKKWLPYGYLRNERVKVFEFLQSLDKIYRNIFAITSFLLFSQLNVFFHTEVTIKCFFYTEVYSKIFSYYSISDF
jgi:hypothetical protein